MFNNVRDLVESNQIRIKYHDMIIGNQQEI